MKMKDQNLIAILLICFGALLLLLGYGLLFNEPQKLNLETSQEIQNENEVIKTEDVVIISYLPSPEIENEIEPLVNISEEERWIVCSIVAGEAGYEPYEGKWAVAQCIWQACYNDNIQPSEVKAKYKYSGWNPNLEFDDPEAWNEIELVVSKMFDKNEKAVDADILWFYAPKYMYNGTSKFHESQTFEIQIDGHKFFSPKEEN